MFSYSPEDEHFCLFWQNYEQRVNLEDCRFDEWERKIIREGQVDEKDEVLFETFCNSVRTTEYEQTYTFRGSFLTWGKNMDTYRVKLVSRTYDGKRLVVGVWTVSNEQSGNVVGD